MNSSGRTIWWPGFCGDRSLYDAFWSDDLTLNTQNPDLSNCLQSTALIWGPNILLWLVSVVYIPHLMALPTLHMWGYISRQNLIKMIAGCLLVAISVADLIYTVGMNFQGPDAPSPLPVEYVDPAVRVASLFLATMYIHWTFRKGIISSGVLFLYWFITLVMAIFMFRSKIIQAEKQNGISDMYRFVTFYVYFGLVLVQFVVSLFADLGALPMERGTEEEEEEEERQPLLGSDEHHRIVQKNPCPKLKASFLSNIFFWWFTKTVIQGYKRPLTMADMWDIRDEDSCAVVLPRFFKYWQKELHKTKQTNSSRGYGSISIQKASVENGAVPSVSIKSDQKPSQKKKPRVAPSLIKALAQTFWAYYIWGGILQLLHDLLMLANPQILNLLIIFVQTKDPYTWRGYVYAVAMFLLSLFVVVFFHNAFNISYTTGMRIRTALTAAIYRKAIRLSSSARKGATVGEIVNLMSVDVQKLQDAPMFFHFLWVSPIIIVIAMYSLWQKLGPSALTGMFFLLILLPVNSIFIGRKIRQYQKEQMKFKDSRIKIMNQILSGIKVLKLYAWEKFFAKKILGIREQELTVIRKAALLNAVNYIVFFCSSFLVGILCFLTFVLSSPNNVLDATTAFVSLSLLNVLAMPLGLLPMSILALVQSLVSLKRINNFLLQDEIDPDAVSHNPDEDAAIQIDGATFSWARNDRVILNGIDVSVQRGSLVAVVGQVGSGKSSLVAAMLGEMYKLSGSVNVKGSIAYVPQQAWIQNMTLKDNILFNKPIDDNKYQGILDACALRQDLNVLPGGDLTEIGEKGINLSGGQKQRVSVARAVYQGSDIYLLDDPLSAVDAHVGKHIFQKVVGPEGMLRDKTRVLVTNAVTFLPQMDKIIVLKDGHVSEQGRYDDLLTKNGDFAEFIRTYLNEVDDESVEEDLLELKRQLSTLSSGGDQTSDGELMSSQEKSIHRRKSRTKSIGMVEKEEKPVKKALIIEETAEEGAIQLSVIKTYINAASWGWAIMAFLSLLGFIAVQSGNSIWLSIWSNDPVVNGTQDTSTTYLRLGVYGGLGVTQALVVFCLGVSVALGSVAASRRLHTKLLWNTLKSPMSFFDTTPLGRIINRFSKDIDILDANIPGYIQNWMSTVAPVISTLIVISYSTPIFVVVAVPLIIIFVILQRVYIACARQIKRVDAIKRSPIYANFSETLNGISSIRAYKEQDRFIQHSDYLLDESQRVWFEVFSSNRWIGIWGELLGDIIILFAGIFAVVERGSLDPGTVGLSVSFSLQVSMSIVMTLRSSCELETYIVAVERIKEYSDNPTEAPWVIEDRRPPLDWPDKGVVDMEKYSTRYRPGLELVLDGISCNISEGEKVGIVGRTGAGKSSMTLALFRIIEAVGGSITIDGRDISTMGLHDIRTKLTIIPQDPVLFSGTLRFNIDPSEKFSDDNVWQAIEQAHLKAFVNSLEEKLEYECGEDGENLSVGQRQLVCLARALLRKTKILVLDEATAAVDLETDDLIQSTIRTEFKECTVLTIAHRLNTVLDYDRVMVMEAGNIREFDSPNTLLADRKSAFYSMAQDAGLV